MERHRGLRTAPSNVKHANLNRPETAVSLMWNSMNQYRPRLAQWLGKKTDFL